MLSPPDSKEHDAPEHLRLTLNGGKSFGTINCANNGRESTTLTFEVEEKICQLRREGWKVCSIARQLRVGDRRVSKVLAKNGFKLRKEHNGEDDD